MLTPEALRWATRRINDFEAVQSGGTMNELVDALSIYREALGFNDECLVILKRWADEHYRDEYLGAILLGFLVGLTVFEYDQ